MSDPIFEGDVVTLNINPESAEMTVTKVLDDMAMVELPNGRGPATFPLDKLTFVRRYSVGRTELTAGDGGED